MSAPRKCDHQERRAGRCMICRRITNLRWYYRHKASQRQPAQTEGARHRRGQVSRLNNWYVRRLLSHRSSVPVKSWPQALVNLKRNLLNLKRQLWQQRELNI